ncbi:MAG: TlpA family protein disulfide reductase [Xanthomonadales bacterium]|nr:TlpA family protein disulfide reductase [Xanthomonadales bacterium]
MHTKINSTAKPAMREQSRLVAGVRASALPGVVLVAFLSLCAAAEAQQKTFRLPQLDGAGELTLEDFHGKVVYLDFWASWCGPCRKSLPLYEALYQGHEPAQFTVLAINLDEDKEDAVRFLQQHPVSYPVLLDPQGVSAADWQVKVMPSSFLLDGSGAVVKEYAGFEESHLEEIRHDIQVLLDGRNSH